METQNQAFKLRVFTYSRTLLIVFLCLIVVTPTLAKNQKDKDKGIDVCHIPPGSPDEVELLHVGSESALDDHLEHGDRIFGKDLNPDCSGGLSIQIDENLMPDTPALPGLMGAGARPVAVLMGPDGRTDEYVVNEFEIKPKSHAELQTFINRYGAVIVRDDVTLIMTDAGAIEQRPGGGWYLVRIDPQTSSLADLPDMIAEKVGSGAFRFSSDAAARTLAILMREETINLTPNLVLKPTSIREHPRVDGADPNNIDDYIHFSNAWWMTEEGISVGVVRAWEYLLHTGLPPVDGVWEPARIAIIDNAFALDEATGEGNPDYLHNPPLQIDLVESNGTANGPAGDDTNAWHGQGSFGVCCAFPRNLFGGAGTGGEYVRPLLIKTAYGWGDFADAVRTAWTMGADVISMSVGYNCFWACDLAEFVVDSHLQEEIITATVFGASVFAAAGNGPGADHNMDGFDDDHYPCELDFVICVGAIDRKADNVWNWGSNVDIWAPTKILSTVSPWGKTRGTAAEEDTNDWGQDELYLFGGTSAATPFAAGIAGLLKTADPTLRWDVVQQILQDTQNTSNDFRIPKDEGKGYVDALRAVQAVRANPPPTADFHSLENGDQRSWARPIAFDAILADPPAPKGFVGSVLFESNIEGEICTAEGDANVLSCEGRLQRLGNHVITLTATDEFGAMSEPTSIRLEIVNRAPSLTLLNPVDGSTRFSDQLVPFRVVIFDLDSEPYEYPCLVNTVVACVGWSSSLDGPIVLPPGGNIQNFMASLSQGVHTIQVTAKDGKGAADTKSAVVTVLAGVGVPTASILEITWVNQDGNVVVVTPGLNLVSPDTTVTLKGSGTDPEDGGLTGASLEWFSDVDGLLGTGSEIQATFSGPTSGGPGFIEHTITLRVTDGDGNQDTDEFVVFSGDIF